MGFIIAAKQHAPSHFNHYHPLPRPLPLLVNVTLGPKEGERCLLRWVNYKTDETKVLGPLTCMDPFQDLRLNYAFFIFTFQRNLFEFYTSGPQNLICLWKCPFHLKLYLNHC